MIALPGLIQQEHRHGEYKEENQPLRIHKLLFSAEQLRLFFARSEQSAQQLLQFLEQCRVIAAAGAAPELYDYIQRVKLCRQLTVHYSDQALYPVTIHRPGRRLFADDQSESRAISGIGQGPGQETFAARPASAGENCFELRRFGQSY